MSTTAPTATKPQATLPEPDINEVSKPYWDALNGGKANARSAWKPIGPGMTRQAKPS
jgi:hypothetical protein